jgi:hypothetical protein
MIAFGFVLALVAWSAIVGLWVLNRLGSASEHRWDGLAQAIPIGLGVLALATLLLGETGLLNRAGLIAIFAIGLIVCRRTFIAPIDRSPCLPRPTAHSMNRERNWFALGLGAMLAVTALGTLLTAQTPVTDGDALCYHLQVPKVFLEQHSALFDPDLHETVYPLVTEMLYAVALAFQGPVSCRLVQWLLGLVFALNVTALARPSLGPRAWWAGAIAMLVPAVSNGMSAALNDVALAAFGTAAMVAWVRYLDRRSIRSAIVVGLLLGFALGVKYPALVLAALLILATAVSPFTAAILKQSLSLGRSRLQGVSALLSRPGLGSHQDSPPASIRFATMAHTLVIGLTAILVGGGWYLRAYVHTGNPVYPFFRQFFGGAGLDVVLDPIKRPMSVNVWNLLTALVPLTLEPDRFDSFSHQFGPLFLLFLPALCLERAPRRVWGIAAIGYAFLALCLTQRQSMRFLLIAIGPLSVAVAWLARRWYARRTVPARILLGLLVLSLGFETSLALARVKHGLGVVLGRETADRYLTRREPTYRVGRWIGENLPADARIVGQEHRGFYIPRPYTMELAHRRRTGLGSAKESPQVIVNHLRAEGFTHLLLCPPVPETAVEFDPTLGKLLDPWLAHESPVYREEVTDPDGVMRRYAIYRLDPVRLAEHRDGRTHR